MATTTNLNARTLGILRLALLMGVLVMGGICWYLGTSGQIADPAAEDLGGMFQVIFVVLLVGQGAALFFIKKRWEAMDTLAKKAPLNIVGWALGESLALLGAVAMLLTGGTLLYLGGLLFFALAWIMFPIPADD